MTEENSHLQKNIVGGQNLLFAHSILHLALNMKCMMNVQQYILCFNILSYHFSTKLKKKKLNMLGKKYSLILIYLATVKTQKTLPCQ